MVPFGGNGILVPEPQKGIDGSSNLPGAIIFKYWEVDTMIKKIIIPFLLLGLILITACSAQKIADIKKTENVGKTVTVSGTVESVIKLGDLSGYTLKDDSGSISVSAEELPSKGDEIRVTGVLIKDTIFGYYIKVN
jgi:hypothetical protein